MIKSLFQQNLHSCRAFGYHKPYFITLFEFVSKVANLIKEIINLINLIPFAFYALLWWV